MDAIKVEVLNALFNDLSAKCVTSVIAIKTERKAMMHLMSVPQHLVKKIEEVFAENNITLIHVPVFEGDFGPVESKH